MNSMAVGVSPERKTCSHRGQGRVQVREARGHGEAAHGLGHQAQDDAGDDPERPLGAQEEPGEVVAHHTFHGAGPGLDDLPGGEHHGEPQDIVPGDAVLHRHGPAGPGGDVPPDGAKIGAAGVGGVIEALAAAAALFSAPVTTPGSTTATISWG